LLGVNNSGKSSLLQPILMLAQTIQDQSPRELLVTSGPLVELNGFYDILHRNSKPEIFEIGLALDRETVRELASRFWTPDEAVLADKLEVSFVLEPRTKEIKAQKSMFFVGDKKLVEVTSRQGNSDMFQVEPADPVSFDLLSFLPTMSWQSPKAGKREEYLRSFGMSVSASHFAWRRAFHGVLRTGPLRVRVPWYSGVGVVPPSGGSLGGAKLIEELGSRETIPSKKNALVDEVNDWISSRTGMPGRVRVKNVDKAGTVRGLFCDELRGARNINAAAMGEGVSQVLPLIARALAGGSSECLFIEQPEIHLHPALQADLADLFIDVVQRLGTQLIVETHSEHLVMRIRQRVAESEVIEAGDVAILYVERDKADSSVRRLNLNDRGHFSDWPKGFFDESYLEAMALAQAASKKPR
jgi:predicted ATPase